MRINSVTEKAFSIFIYYTVVICRNRGRNSDSQWTFMDFPSFPSESWISWFITTGLSKDTPQSTQNTRLVMALPADSSFSSFCPYSSCLSLCLKNTGKLPVFLHIIPQSLQALFRIRAEKNNKQVVFLRTLNLHSLRFERNGDKGDSTLTFFFLNASQTLNHRTISTL